MTLILYEKKKCCSIYSWSIPSHWLTDDYPTLFLLKKKKMSRPSVLFETLEITSQFDKKR